MNDVNGKTDSVRYARTTKIHAGLEDTGRQVVRVELKVVESKAGAQKEIGHADGEVDLRLIRRRDGSMRGKRKMKTGEHRRRGGFTPPSTSYAGAP